MIKRIFKPIKYLASGDFKLRRKRWWLRVLKRLPFGLSYLRHRYAPEAPHLELEAFGMRFASPIGMAAGFDCNGDMIDAFDAMGFGFIEVGSITPQPQHNKRGTSLYELKGSNALLNTAPIDSAGIEKVIENIKARNSRIVVGCNITKNSLTSDEKAPKEYLRLFRPLYQYTDFFTINICCNSTSDSFIPTDHNQIMEILTPLFEFRRGQNQYRPILLKISPDLSDEQIDLMTTIMLDTPLDGIVASGGTVGRYGLENSKQEMHSLGRIPGAFCGSPLKERTLQIIRRIHKRSQGTYPIIACGGITTPDDAMEMLEAGATLVELYTGFYYGGQKTMRNIRMGLNERIRKAKIAAAQQESASSQTQVTPSEAEQTTTEE